MLSDSRVPRSLTILRDGLRRLRAVESGTVAERWDVWVDAAQRAGCAGPHDLHYWLVQTYGARCAVRKPIRPRRPTTDRGEEFLDVEIADPPTPEPEADRRYGVAP